MNINERIRFWKKLAQENESGTTTQVGSAPTISLSQIPTFKVNLFSNKPEFSQDLQLIVNLLNKYLFMLTGGKLDFSSTWKSPSIGPSQFTSAVKNIYSLCKWIYNIVSSNEPPYSIDGLKKVVKDFNDTVAGMDFPDPKTSGFKSEVVSLSQSLLNKLGS